MTLISFKERYNANPKQLASDLNVANVNSLPKIEKVTINVGTGRFRGNKDMLTFIEQSLTTIAGQKPVVTKSKKSISGFKLREGEEIGYKVTLRGQKMTDFIDRLVNITLPRIREFKGFERTNFDRQGNLTIGFSEIAPFAELGHTALDHPFGLAITLTISQSDREKSIKLLQALGLPVKID